MITITGKVKMKRHFLYSVVISVFIIVSCTQVPYLATGQPTELMNTPPSTSTAIIKHLPSSEGIATKSPTLVDSSNDGCLEVKYDIYSNWVSNGSLILIGREDIGNGLLRHVGYLANMDTREKSEITKPGENIFDISISPDRKWMAYELYELSSKSDNLIIADYSGNQLLRIPWEAEWIYISSWLDNTRLILGTNTESTEGSLDGPYFLTLNPFTNERAILVSDFQQIFEATGFTGLDGRGYNSGLDRVVYLRGDQAFLNPLHYILWDIDQHQMLADFEVVIKATAYPSWLPDGSNFILAASIKDEIYKTWPAYELYNISRDGQIKQLTHLTDNYLWTFIEDYSWSPDGNHIAFWFSWWSDKKPSWDLLGKRYLAIVNTENEEINIYCVEGFPGKDGRVPIPVWSPNGSQLAVQSRSNQGNHQVMIIDLEKQMAVQLYEDLTPVGWMVSP